MLQHSSVEIGTRKQRHLLPSEARSVVVQPNLTDGHTGINANRNKEAAREGETSVFAGQEDEPPYSHEHETTQQSEASLFESVG